MSLYKIFLLLFISSQTLFLNASHFVFNTSTDKLISISNTFEDDLYTFGYTSYEAHKNIQEGYKKMFADKNSPDFDQEYVDTLEYLHIFSVAQEDILAKLLIRDPNLAVCFPLTLYMYKQIDKSEAFVSHLEPSYILESLSIKDNTLKKEFEDSLNSLDNYLENKLVTKKKMQGKKLSTTESYSTFNLTLPKQEAQRDFVDSFQDQLEKELEEKGFVIMDYIDYHQSFQDKSIEFGRYEIYRVYTFCDFTFSYKLFAKTDPSLGVYAPCRLYIYKEKKSNKLVYGVSRLTHMFRDIKMKDKALKNSIEFLENKIEAIMQNLESKKYE